MVVEPVQHLKHNKKFHRVKETGQLQLNKTIGKSSAGKFIVPVPKTKFVLLAEVKIRRTHSKRFSLFTLTRMTHDHPFPCFISIAKQSQTGSTLCVRARAHLFGVLLKQPEPEPLVQLHLALVPDSLQLPVVRKHLRTRKGNERPS